MKRIEDLGEEHGALIAITGDPEPELLSDLDQDRVGKRAAGQDRRGAPPQRHGRARSTGRSSATRTRAGRRRSSASPTSSGSGPTSSARSASTSPTPSPPGTSTSQRLDERCRPAERAPLRRGPLPRPRNRPDGRAQREVALDAPATRRRRSAAATCRTCRPRRSSRRRTGAARRAPSARRCRSRCPATSSATSS